MSEPTPRREVTQQRLIQAAIHEFSQRGIDGTSVEQLCERAGFSRGAFYSNFATKDDLCIAILEDHTRQLMTSLSKFFQDIPKPSIDWVVNEALTGYLDSIGPTLQIRRTLLEIRIRATRNPELLARVQEFDTKTQPALDLFLVELAHHLGFQFRLPVSHLTNICTMVFLSPNADSTNYADLIKTLVQAAIDEKPPQRGTMEHRA